jgi:hypothetical protein
MANKHRKVWKVISRKLLSRKQTWPKFIRIQITIYYNSIIMDLFLEKKQYTKLWR